MNSAVTPGGIVVRGDESIAVLHEVGAEQQMLAGFEAAGELVEELGPVRRREVADRAAEERDQPVAAVVRQQREVALEVADHGVHRRARIGGRDRLAGGAQRGGAAVERNEASQLAGIAQRVEQQARLGRRARAELDERVGAAGGRDLARPLLEDLALAAGGVVLRQAGDLVEELRAALVVEPLRRKDFWRPT